MIPRDRALLAVPLLLTLHNAEEALTIPAALDAVLRRLPTRYLALAPTYPQFLIGLALVTVIVWAAYLSGRGRLVALLVIQAVVLVNVAWHLAAAVMLRGYTPGLATALAVNLPFSVYLLARAWRERWVGRGMMAALLPLALLLHGPGLLLLMWLSGRLAAAVG